MNKKQAQITNFQKESAFKEADSQRKQTSGYQWGEGSGEGHIGVKN